MLMNVNALHSLIPSSTLLLYNLFPMRILLLSWLFLISFSLDSIICMDSATLVSGQYQSNQQSLLIQMKSSLIFNSSLSVHLVKWNESRDCCTWGGVDCDVAGRVIGLNLSNESISGGIENATGLFSLQYLESLNLAFNMFKGIGIPSRLANLTTLTYVNLSNAGFKGQIPGKIPGMTMLVTLDLSSNQLAGPIPSFHLSKSLSYLDLSHNFFTGLISSTSWEGLLNLAYVDMSNNLLNGSIPGSLFALPSLRKLQLAGNQFEGLVPEFLNTSSSELDTLDLSDNRLEGCIPMSIFQLKKLQSLVLSSNKFNGTLHLGMFQRLVNLSRLDLSYNRLAVKASSSKSPSLPQINILRLASCKLSVIPNLKNQPQLSHLDLSDNQISGEIPNWIWELGKDSLIHLNLSHNLLVGMEGPYSISSLGVLDLHSNQLQGNIPHQPPTAVYVDYSSNNFTSSIPVDIGNSLSSTIFFSLSNNSLAGAIPESICNATKLQVLNLSNNKLNGSIPTCLIERRKALGVLNLRGNKLDGTIFGTFPEGCKLQTLDLNGNQLKGVVPKSLINCSKLEVLDLGNNHIHDAFPCWLKNISTLRVLVFRSNNFYGRIACPTTNNFWLLQIIDLAFNNFTGPLPDKYQIWVAMMFEQNQTESKPEQVRYEFHGFNQLYYQDQVTLTIKGQNMELVKILTLFTSIDLSCNNFQGLIPKEIGRFVFLRVLNLSHNSITGTIPPSLGNLRQLESLDLSSNNLSGVIPSQLASLSFLSFLNLSYNHLKGRIPSGTQLQSFPSTSYDGNVGLCGPPLTKDYTICSSPKEYTNSSAPPPSAPASKNKIDWMFILMAIGFAIGFGATVAPLIFSKKVDEWYDHHINKCLN